MFASLPVGGRHRGEGHRRTARFSLLCAVPSVCTFERRCRSEAGGRALDSTKPTVGILAGGRSRRFGRDKALFPINGTPLLLHLVSRFQRSGFRVIVAGRRYADILPSDVTVVCDVYPERGPLGGIHAILRQAMPAGTVFVVPCDLPFFDPRLVVAAYERWHEEDWALLLRDDFGPQPTIGLYSARCLRVADACLRRGENIVWALLWRVPHRFVSVGELLPGADPEMLFNLNSPEDGDKFRWLLRSREHWFRSGLSG